MQKRQRRLDFGFGNDGHDKVLSSLKAGDARIVGGLAPDCLIRVDRELVGAVKRDVEIVRVYDDPGRQRNEYRVLVDRLWPRGQSKGAVDHDEWVKDATPSTELRQWYGHEPKRFSEFARRYRAELALPPGSGVVSQLRETSETQRLVLLTATRDIEHSGAIVLRDDIVGTDGT
jgi:uncharacterized protein YeaO (DUF488 family)